MSRLLQGPAAVAHLMRRAGFGPDAATWTEWRSLDYQEAVDRVLAELDAPPPTDPAGLDVYEPGRVQQLWLERMRAAPCGLGEKLALFWHGHFATSNAKIQDAQLMWTQYRLLRSKGAGPFEDLVLGISRDVAMIRWLDGNANRAGPGNANENYARELQELFTLGIGNYTEQDIREVARAFTGWGSRHHDFVFRGHFHDDGRKTVHGQSGRFDGHDVVKILVGLPACARFLAGKLLRFFSHPDPSADEVERLAATLRAHGMDVRAGLAALLRSESFRDATRQRALVKAPVEFVVSAIRAVGSPTVPGWVHGSLDAMGQILFRPPSVKGWTSGRGWLSSGAIVERMRCAQRIALHDGMQPLDGLRPTLAQVAFQGEMPPPLQEALADEDDAQRAAALILASPEFQLA